MVFWLQIGSALTGLVAAALWFLSALRKSPAMTYDGLGHLEDFLNGAGRLNRWAAGVTAISILLSAAATSWTAVGHL
jgi:hypothetical protein